MKSSDHAMLIHAENNRPGRPLRYAALALLLAAALTGCGNKDKKGGQALVSVNGEEITALQLNEELQRAGVQAGQQADAKKQLLESLVERQLLLNQATKEKIDRDPKVVQAIERAKALIIAQAYMQKKLGGMARPSKEEVADYFQKHPEFFSQRKQYDMRQLLVASQDLDAPLRKAMDDAKSLDEVAAWLEQHKVKFTRSQVARSTTDLAPALVAKIDAMSKGQLFIVKEGERSLLMVVSDARLAPVGLETAAPQIEQYLTNMRAKEAAATELARLRTGAKIDYLNKELAAAKPAAPAPAKPADAAAEVTARGVAGLK